MLHRLWLIFAQVCAVGLGILFVVSTLRPEWVRVPLLGSETQSAPAAVTVSPAPSPPAAQAPGGTSTVAPVASFAPAVKRALPAVVSIATSRVDRRSSFEGDPILERLFGRRNSQAQERPLGEGSGAIVSPDGLVLTNFHVIQGATKIEVQLVDGRMLRAKVVGADPESDLAVLRVEEKNLPYMNLGNSDGLQVGDVVLAMGNPFGISNTVTMGIVSALSRRRVSDTNPFEDFIQTDAAINPGNSGGPLVNTDGELVGINTAIFTRTGTTAGIGFSIPSNHVKSSLEQIVATGAVTRGYLGVSMGGLTPEIARLVGVPETLRGAVIGSVIDEGPAGQAGLRPNDVIVEINGKAVPDEAQAISAIANTKPGTTVPIKIVRRSETLTLSVKLETRPVRLPRR
jgi:Do/DeqQ family serine protease